MPRFAPAFLAAAALTLPLSLAGCSDADQLDDANDALIDERGETAEEAADAREDGVLDGEERDDLREEVGEDAAAAGEVAEQRGEYIEGKLDD